VTRLKGRSAALVFGKTLRGSYLVFDRARGEIVAEVSKNIGSTRRLHVRPGRYYLKKREPRHVLIQKIHLGAKEKHVVRDHQMKTLRYEEDVTKGRLSPMFHPAWMYGAPPWVSTAWTLRRNEYSIGFWRSSGYGLSDRLTIQTSWLLALLGLRPQVRIKAGLVQRHAIAWSLSFAVNIGFWARVRERQRLRRLGAPRRFRKRQTCRSRNSITESR
jgi:hypothetical protein